MIKQLPFTLLLFISFKTFTQETRKFLYASLTDEIGLVSNAHIINLNTNQGTFSNENGQFRILAQPNDSLRISFVGYETKKVRLSHKHFGIQKTVFKLQKITIELDEVQIKKHYLTGFISIDIKQTPKDSIGDLVGKLVSNIKGLKFYDIVNMPIGEDEMHLVKVKAPGVPNSFSGVALASIDIGGKKHQEEKKLLEILKEKEKFPKKLLSEFGSVFFFKKLKIPKENYLHFLEYCDSLGIEKLYKQGNILKVIDILQQESVGYLKIIHKKE